MIAAAAWLVLGSAGACRRADDPRAQVPDTTSAPARVNVDPLSELDRADGLPAARAAEICERAAGRLTAAQRKRCSEVHVAHATALIEQKRFREGRVALAFAETEGASLEQVRALRRQIPDYHQLTVAQPSAERRTSRSSHDLRRSAASRFTNTFASSLLKGFDIRGVAAGEDCSVLLVTFYVKMEDSMITALHRGDILYGRIMPGGARAFAAQNGFRAVVYRDGYDTTWSYGAISSREAARLKECS